MQAWKHPTTKPWLQEVLGNDEVYQFQAMRFDVVYGNRHSWDVAWLFTKLLDAGLTIVPAVNLIRNIGCLGGNSLPPTHAVANMPTSPMTFPLRHPRAVDVDREHDAMAPCPQDVLGAQIETIWMGVDLQRGSGPSRGGEDGFQIEIDPRS